MRYIMVLTEYATGDCTPEKKKIPRRCLCVALNAGFWILRVKLKDSCFFFFCNERMGDMTTLPFAKVRRDCGYPAPFQPPIRRCSCLLVPVYTTKTWAEVAVAWMAVRENSFLGGCVCRKGFVAWCVVV